MTEFFNQLLNPRSFVMHCLIFINLLRPQVTRRIKKSTQTSILQIRHKYQFYSTIENFSLF